MRCDFIVSDRGPQIILEQGALTDKLVHAGFEKREPATARILRAPQRKARPMKKGFRVPAIGEADCSPRRCADGNGLLAQHHGRLDGGQRRRQPVHQLFLALARQQRDEFIGLETSDKAVDARAHVEDLADLDQHFIAQRAAVGVVERFEPIDVDHHDAEPAGAVILAEEPVEHALEMAAVGKPGQLVVHRHATGAFFRLEARLQFAHVGAVARDHVESEANAGEDDGAEQSRQRKGVGLRAERIEQPDHIEVHRKDEACRDKARKHENIPANLRGHLLLGRRARLGLGLFGRQFLDSGHRRTRNCWLYQPCPTPLKFPDFQSVKFV